MPHDRNGELLKPGDRVSMEFTVKAIHATEELCNMDLQSIYPLYPSENFTTLSAVNTRQVEKVKA